ncbi:MAG: UPF0158 family protein [candidate division WOR-3 bacterium]
MRKLIVLERDILFALTNQMRDISHYLDLETGDVIPVFSYNREAILTQIKAEPARFVRIMPQTSRHGREMMNRFVETVKRPDLKARLKAAIKSDRAFSRFRRVLLNFPDEFKHWQRFRVMFLTEPLKIKLREQGIELILVPESE